MDPWLTRLGSGVADAEDEALRRFDHARQRDRFLAHATGGAAGATRAQAWARARARRWPALLLLAGATAAMVLLARRAPALRFDVAGVAGQEGEWIAAPGATPLPLAFSDGTRVTLAERARARVVDSTPNGARVVLERGRIAADVAHRAGARWRVDAGPFKVHVVGTRFDVSWDPDQERFALALAEGSVRVVGPTVPGGRTVVAGDRLEVALGPGRRAEAAPAPRSDEALSPSLSPPPSQPPAVAPAPAPSWRDLAARGVHTQAWRAVEREGFEAIVASARPADLAALADVARFSHHPAHAEKALADLRARFPHDRRASEAAFLLGRLAFDQREAPADAASWFSAYLRERPDGMFAREAAGRLIECQQRLGAAGAARAAAERYLGAYPTGPHAALARAALEATGTP